MNEADTCRREVVPRLQAAGWDDEPHSIAEQRTITDGRIVPAGKGFIRRPPKRVNYLLRYTRDFPLAVVEAKASYKTAADGLQQAKAYAEILGLHFAYATNGLEIVEFDFFTGLEKPRGGYPKPDELWKRYCQGRELPSPEVANQSTMRWLPCARGRLGCSQDHVWAQHPGPRLSRGAVTRGTTRVGRPEIRCDGHCQAYRLFFRGTLLCELDFRGRFESLRAA